MKNSNEIQRKMQKVCGEKQIYAYLEEGIVIFNKDFVVLYCNDSVVQHLGEDASGRNINELVSTNDFMKLINSKENEMFEINFRVGGQKWLKGRCYLFNEIDQGEEVYTLFIKDYNEEKLSQKEVKQILDKLPYIVAVQDLDEKNLFINEIGKRLERIAYKDELRIENLKNEFVANISHEIKTPVNVIYSMLQLVELELMERQEYIEKYDKEMWIKLERYRQITKQNIFRLIRLASHISDISEIDAGICKMHLENYDMIQIIDSIVNAAGKYVQSREIKMSTSLSEESVIMAVDAERFERIMLNLISNAVKFSSVGCKILVEVKRNENQLVIQIKDNGIGIPKEKLNMIFEKFTQVDNIYTRKHEGSGIGLAFVKEMLRLMNGEISVESKENQGSCFTIKLPIRRVEGKGVCTFGEREKRIFNCQAEMSDIYDL